MYDSMLGGTVLHQLLDWWQQRFIPFDQKARDVMHLEHPEREDDYWNAVLSVVKILVFKFDFFDFSREKNMILIFQKGTQFNETSLMYNTMWHAQ